MNISQNLINNQLLYAITRNRRKFRHWLAIRHTVGARLPHRPAARQQSGTGVAGGGHQPGTDIQRKNHRALCRPQPNGCGRKIARFLHRKRTAGRYSDKQRRRIFLQSVRRNEYAPHRTDAEPAHAHGGKNVPLVRRRYVPARQRLHSEYVVDVVVDGNAGHTNVQRHQSVHLQPEQIAVVRV